MDIEKISNEYINEAPFEERPNFYSSMSDNPSTNRFAGNVNNQNPKVVRVTEYCQSVTKPNLSIIFRLKYTYTTRPIVRILAKFANGTVEQYDANVDLTINNSTHTLSVDTRSVNALAYAIARIYSLDNY